MTAVHSRAYLTYHYMTSLNYNTLTDTEIEICVAFNGLDISWPYGGFHSRRHINQRSVITLLLFKVHHFII